MRILYVITGLHKGGAEGQLLELCGRMNRRGHQLEVVTALPASGYADDIKAMGIPVHSLEIQLGSLNPNAIPRLAKHVWRFRPQVVHSMMVHSNLLTRVTRLLSPEPVLVNTALGVSESSSPEKSSRPREFAYALTDWLADVTTQVSEVCADRYVDVRAVPRRKMRVVPCGVDSERFRRLAEPERDAARTEFSVPREGFTWISVGRFTADKDHRTLIEAFDLVRQDEPSSRLILKGIGALEAELREQIASLRLETHVRLLTERIAMERFLNTGHAFVLSSVREGMPTVLLEAAGCELPIVATDVGGNPEVARVGQNGLVVPARNARALAGAMLELMRLPESRRQEMARAGRRIVERQYDFETITTQYEHLYRELRAKKGLVS